MITCFYSYDLCVFGLVFYARFIYWCDKQKTRALTRAFNGAEEGT